MFDGLVCPELRATLTHFTLGLDTVGDWYQPPKVSFPWDDLLEKTLSSLQPLHKLTHLRIIIHSKGHDVTDSDVSSPPTHADELARTLHGSTFDFKRTAAPLVRQRLPSLRYLFLTTCGYLVHHNQAGEVTTKTLVELHDEVAEATIQKEELVLSEAYKRWFSRDVSY
ncbi:hypothetical protein LXA43DRAFT_1104814 [Ganoderma leucocontextum]|nr:hypothetical protein LXA43DRAFT_1104814 [Ganoderma leucocontextum]